MTELEAKIEQLLKQVERLSDRQQIYDCVVSYCRGLDRLDPEFIRSSFHSDGIDDHGAFVGDVDTFVPWAIECEAGFELTHHAISNFACEISGHVAHTESYIEFYVLFRDEAKVGVGLGRYIDRLEKRDGRWGIAVRRFVLDFMFEAPKAGFLGPEWSAVPTRRDLSDLTYQRPLRSPRQ